MSDDLSWTAAPGLVAIAFFALRDPGAGRGTVAQSDPEAERLKLLEKD